MLVYTETGGYTGRRHYAKIILRTSTTGENKSKRTGAEIGEQSRALVQHHNERSEDRNVADVASKDKRSAQSVAHRCSRIIAGPSKVAESEQMRKERNRENGRRENV
jgi:hypothetical protein